MSLFDTPIDIEEYYCIHMTPATSPRPRATIVYKSGKPFATVYMPDDYTKYKYSLGLLITKLGIKQSDYSELEVIAYFPYPASTADKKRIEGAKMRVKPDADNVFKAVMDTIADVNVLIKGDSRISDIVCRKRYTINKEGRILFKLTI